MLAGVGCTSWNLTPHLPLKLNPSALLPGPPRDSRHPPDTPDLLISTYLLKHVSGPNFKEGLKRYTEGVAWGQTRLGLVGPKTCTIHGQVGEGARTGSVKDGTWGIFSLGFPSH